MIKDTSATDIELTAPVNNKRKWLVLSSLVIASSAIAYFYVSGPSASRSVERTSVQVATLEIGDLVRDVLSTGRIVAANAPQLYSPEQGFVNLNVNAGDEVSIGQVVASVDSPVLQNQLQQQRSEMERLNTELARTELDARRQTLQLNKLLDLAEVDLQAAMREERRAQSSIVNNLISQIDLEKAVDDLARAKLTFKHAQQEVALATDTLSFELDSARSTVSRQSLVISELERKTSALNILATVNGVVGTLLTQPRALVSQNQPLMTLVDLSAYEAELNVSESYANELGLGMAVEITLGGQTLMGKLSGISPEVNNREVTTRVRFDQQIVKGIRQNQQLNARILLENKSNVLKVRRGSFVQAGGFVAYKLEGKVATRVPIQMGATSIREVEILTGLQANDQIIISSYEAFKNADSIMLN